MIVDVELVGTLCTVLYCTVPEDDVYISCSPSDQGEFPPAAGGAHPGTTKNIGQVTGDRN